jgi:hypothetical protein
MRHIFIRAAAVAAVGALAVCATVAGAAGAATEGHAKANRDVVRFSTFNASLNRGSAGQLVTDLSTTHRRGPWRRSSSAHGRRSC